MYLSTKAKDNIIPKMHLTQPDLRKMFVDHLKKINDMVNDMA